MNPLARGYQGKSTTKQAARKATEKSEAAVQKSEANQSAIAQLQQMVLGMSYKLYELETKLQRAENVARVADTRSTALQNLVSKAGISQEDVMAEIMSIQANDFEEASAADDAKRGLEKVEDANATAAIGQHAIMTLSFFKDGSEIIEERIVRSKIELGKKELLGELLDDAVIGMKVGESKEISLDIAGKIDTAKVTLLGLRNAPAAEAAPAEGQAAENTGASEPNTASN